MRKEIADLKQKTESQQKKIQLLWNLIKPSASTAKICLGIAANATYGFIVIYRQAKDVMS